MKKILFLMIAAIALSGCNNKDEVTDSLKGTVWVCERDESMTETIRFTDDKNVTVELKSNDGKINNSIKGTYTYNPPTIVIHVYLDGESVSVSMTLKGNTIELISEDGTFIYEKK
jgi:uncharacterized lipoprotein NlpE involved in copper resistance